MNERSKQGVTVDNNSAVLFWKAIGPAPIGAATREQYFKMLGIEPLPAEGEYFQSLADFAKHAAAKSKSASAPLDPEQLETKLEELTARMDEK